VGKREAQGSIRLRGSGIERVNLREVEEGENREELSNLARAKHDPWIKAFWPKIPEENRENRRIKK